MIKNLLDKLCFALGVIVFLQLPHFIDQYTQRLGGFEASQNQQLKEYQLIADQHFSGDLSAYVAHLAQNNDPAIAAAAGMVSETLASQLALKKELQVFEQEPLWYQMPYFLSHMRMDLTRGTFQNFAPGVPINIWAWGYGIIGGVLFSLLFNGAIKSPQLIRKQISRKKQAPLTQQNKP